MASPAVQSRPISSKTESYVDNKRKDDIRMANINSARSVADAVRTSLGPKGMDKMISTASGEVIITNDGATILNKMEVLQPAAKMLVELSKSQDIVAGDGTTTVVVIAGALLKQCQTLLHAGIHPTVVSDSLHKVYLNSQGAFVILWLSSAKYTINCAHFSYKKLDGFGFVVWIWSMKIEPKTFGHFLFECDISIHMKHIMLIILPFFYL